MRPRYGMEPMDISGLRTFALSDRGGKVRTDMFAKTWDPATGISGLLHSLPRLLAGDSFRSVVDAIRAARDKQKPVIWAIGGHVIKCGLAPLLIDLMQQGYATGFAMNGAASIHDLEIALCGFTSEDVDASLPVGEFGVAEETGRAWNTAIHGESGIGECLGLALESAALEQYAESSLLLQAWRNHVPVTVHVAIGTDITHIHPAVNPGLLGNATHHDFRLFCSMAAQLDNGGVFINAGSAVVLPEVFLKALSCVRNLGNPVDNFTTVNLDFLQQYRPSVNVIHRPHTNSGGKGYAITGHHEITIPLLAACLKDR